MAITFRNKIVEEKIRAIGRRTGEGPSDVIARLVAAEEPDRGWVGEVEAARREAAWNAFVAGRPDWTEAQLAASRAFENDMYDENGLPK